MREYELTERGKIIIAVLIAVILLALAAVLTVKAFGNQAPRISGNQDSSISKPVSSPPDGMSSESPIETPEGTPSGTSTETPFETPTDFPPTTSNSPPPHGGDFNQPDDAQPPANSNEEEESDPPGGQTYAPPPPSGPTGGNPSEGTLSFLFSPNYQDELDTETKSLLKVLLDSPSNTLNSIIAVETSTLPDDYAQTLMSAVATALAEYGVPEQRAAHVLNPSGAVGETFEVSFYFIPAGGK